MTPRVEQIINDNIALIETDQFLDLFNICPAQYREELLQVLIDSDIEITDPVVAPMYALKQSGLNVLAVENKDRKSKTYTVTVLRNPKHRIVAFKSLLDAIKASTQVNCTINLLSADFVDGYDWEPISTNIGDCWTTVDTVEEFDPTIQKEIRIRKAARDEYDRQVMDLIKRRLFKGTKEQLISEIAPFAFENKYGERTARVYFTRNGADVYIDHDPADEDEIVRTIKKHLALPAEVHPENSDLQIIHIHAYGKKIDAIRAEVTDTFGVAF